MQETAEKAITSIGRNAFNKRLTVVCPVITLTVKKGSYAEHYANYEAHWPMHYYYEGNDELQHPMSEFEDENYWWIRRLLDQMEQESIGAG